MLDKCGPIVIESPNVAIAMAEALAPSHPQLAATLLEEVARAVRRNAHRSLVAQAGSDPEWSDELRVLLDLHSTLSERARRLRG